MTWRTDPCRHRASLHSRSLPPIRRAIRHGSHAPHGPGLHRRATAAMPAPAFLLLRRCAAYRPLFILLPAYPSVRAGLAEGGLWRREVQAFSASHRHLQSLCAPPYGARRSPRVGSHKNDSERPLPVSPLLLPSKILPRKDLCCALCPFPVPPRGRTPAREVQRRTWSRRGQGAPSDAQPTLHLRNASDAPPPAPLNPACAASSKPRPASRARLLDAMDAAASISSRRPANANCSQRTRTGGSIRRHSAQLRHLRPKTPAGAAPIRLVPPPGACGGEPTRPPALRRPVHASRPAVSHPGAAQAADPRGLARIRPPAMVHPRRSPRTAARAHDLPGGEAP